MPACVYAVCLFCLQFDGIRRKAEDRTVQSDNDADAEVKDAAESYISVVSDGDDDEDDTKALLAELARIKKERAEEKLSKT
ncbi:hypothetical protein MUK42_34086 [Musa troglodytarum]|uniref:Uncharacterized protein n=1 Tax=Musa troglodytarum TaxID=320322 RepID=A0A9E7JC04_9LILI|nr:hypothetical protein MUK42_34086 [Musa troglodytarum]